MYTRRNETHTLTYRWGLAFRVLDFGLHEEHPINQSSRVHGPETLLYGFWAIIGFSRAVAEEGAGLRGCIHLRGVT